MKRNIAASGASPKRRSRNMKPTRQPKTAAPEPMKVRSFAEPFEESFSIAALQWPPVDVPTRLRSTARTVESTLPRWQSVKRHAVLGVNVATGPRGSTGVRPRYPRRPVLASLLSPFPSTRLLCLLEAALGTDTPAVGTPVGTLVMKIQSSDCSALAAVDAAPSVIPGSEVSDVAGASTPLLQQNVKLHPVLGFFVHTRRRTSGCLCLCSRVPELLSLLPGGNCEN